MLLALIGALVIGLSLGLLGSGGSILTVPILVYVVGQPEKIAIAGSLAIVGGIALAGALPRTFKRQVDWRSVVWFGLPGMVGTVFGAWLSQWLSGAMQLLLFAVVMLAAAFMMFRQSAASAVPAQLAPRRRAAIVLDGVGVGTVTGVVGIGGGFMIVPALVLLGGLRMQVAIGTSLWIIAANAFSGFVKHWLLLHRAGVALDWTLIFTFIGIGAAGTVIGMQIADRLPQALLKRVFAGFLVVMGVFIVYRTLPGLL